MHVTCYVLNQAWLGFVKSQITSYYHTLEWQDISYRTCVINITRTLSALNDYPCIHSYWSELCFICSCISMYIAIGCHSDYGSFFLAMWWQQFILYIIAVLIVGSSFDCAIIHTYVCTISIYIQLGGFKIYIQVES